MVNRKLVRPHLNEMKDRPNVSRPFPAGEPSGGATHVRDASAPGPHGPVPKRRPAPPEQTGAEAFYYVKQMNNRTPMVVVLESGEALHGHIEWYDRGCIKLNRDGAPNLLLYKHAIRYMHKVDESPEQGS